MEMKLFRQIIIAALLFIATFSASAQIYVQVRPIFPVVVRPSQPSPVYVWVNEEWVPSGNGYIYTGGHWEAPARRGYYRTQGYWIKNKQGQKWVPGKWQGRNNRGKNHKH
ncbi:MAG: hypothetical protein ACOYKE_12940 [Ferruginibacter sp.]